LPSKIQTTDAYFNSLASLGLCASIDDAACVLLDRDMLENYKGIDRDGARIDESKVINYLVNLFLTKETLVQEMHDLSTTFNVKTYSILLTTGSSIKIYGSLENMLNAMLLEPLLSFDLSSSTLIYVLLRMPMNLKDKLPRDKIELAIAGWFKGKADLSTIYVTEPIYVEEKNDRIDLIMFVGGFDTTKILEEFENKAKFLKGRAVGKGFINEEEWKALMEKLKEQKE
jgi:hypothetical protein